MQDWVNRKCVSVILYIKNEKLGWLLYFSFLFEGRKTDIFHLLVYCPDAHRSHCWARLNSGAQNLARDWVYPTWWLAPKYLGHHLLSFVLSVSRKLAWNQWSWDSDQDLCHEMQMSHVDLAAGQGLRCWLRCLHPLPAYGAVD